MQRRAPNRVLSSAAEFLPRHTRIGGNFFTSHSTNLYSPFLFYPRSFFTFSFASHPSPDLDASECGSYFTPPCLPSPLQSRYTSSDIRFPTQTQSALRLAIRGNYRCIPLQLNCLQHSPLTDLAPDLTGTWHQCHRIPTRKSQQRDRVRDTSSRAENSSTFGFALG